MVLGCGRKEGLEKADPVTVLKDIRDKGNRRPCHWLNLLLIFRYNSGGTFYKGVFDTIWENVEILIIQCHLNLEKAISTAVVPRGQDMPKLHFGILPICEN